MITRLLSRVQTLQTNLCHTKADNVIKSDYMETIWYLILLSVATRIDNIDLHILSFQQLCPLLFSMNNQNCANA